MYTIKALPEFSAWLSKVKDTKTRVVIAARIKRLELGNMGDAKSVGSGVTELRIHEGAGWRVYFTVRGNRIVVLLAGGTKRTQDADIKRAQALAAKLE